ncbi:NepR family anti-sigma factor [Litoreibacter halocynthiae]|uniref:NepR family anti-sigma factor n=1 Tax=Litoreibacter halocynthiae TaxID=1242689 RepID=UPI00249042DC|nr:NepR family anti-sigma factor [Litoreibacter halocynthiae]
MASDEKKIRGEKQIDENLKRVYEEVVNEEIPDRFKDLLSQLKSQSDDDGSDVSR